jgi:hypothetical protein
MEGTIHMTADNDRDRQAVGGCLAATLLILACLAGSCLVGIGGCGDPFDPWEPPAATSTR